MGVILHLDLQDFLVSVERKHDPSLTGRPLIIGGQPTGWGRVVAASREAAERGVKPGMSLSVAASRCPRAIFLDGEFDRYLDASAAIDELLREPGVPVEWTSIDSAFLDLTPPGGSPTTASSPSTSTRDAPPLTTQPSRSPGSPGFAGTVAALASGAPVKHGASVEQSVDQMAPGPFAAGAMSAGVARAASDRASSGRGGSWSDRSQARGSRSDAARSDAAWPRGSRSNGSRPGGSRSDASPSDARPGAPWSSESRSGAARPGAARQVAERVQAALRDQLGFTAACGIASTKIAAQIASRLARPAGLLYVLPGYEERLLAPLDVALLPDLPPGVAPRLHRAGVLTLGHLAALDPARAEPLVGRRAAEFARLARGLDDRAVDGASPPRSVARDLTLPEPTQSPAELESVTQYLAETLASRIRRLGCFAQTVTVRLRGGVPGAPERTFARSTTLREATATDGDLVVAAHALLNLLRRQVRVVAGVAIVLSNLHQGGTQMPLFPLSNASMSRGTRHDALADIRGRAGFRALVRGHFAAPPAPRRRAG